MNERNPAPTSPLYSKLPYPADGIIRTTSARVLQRGLSRFAPHLADRRPLRILDVGCGTGEATCGLARVFPRAEVVGLDINPPSLELAAALARRHNLPVRILRCDISRDLASQLADAGAWDEGRRFDLITSMGVLHHLAEPVAGFRHVRALAADESLFLCYIYSRLGRWHDLAVRELLDRTSHLQEFARRAELVRALQLSGKYTLMHFLKRLRRRLKFGPPLSWVEIAKVYFNRKKLTHVSDTFSSPCECLYDWAGLRGMCESAGWRSLGLAPGGGLPTTPEEHTGSPRALAALRGLTEDMLFDYFAFFYEMGGFQFFLKPA